VLGPHQRRRNRKRDVIFSQPPQRVLGCEQAMETALGVFQRGLDGVPAVKNRGAVAVARPPPYPPPRAGEGRVGGLGLAGTTATNMPATRQLAGVAPGRPGGGMAVIGIALTHARSLCHVGDGLAISRRPSRSEYLKSHRFGPAALRGWF